MGTRFQTIWEQVLRGEPASLAFEAEGTVYIRSFRPEERLIILGGGHIAQPLCRYGADLGFAVTVADDRPAFSCRSRFPEAGNVICDSFPNALRTLRIGEADYVAVVTRGHRYDADCLRSILSGQFPRYLGMIGSKQRVAGLFQLLEKEGVSPAALQKIHAPIGLDINALTTVEIAVSIAAELIQCRRQNAGRRTGETVLAVESADLSLLEFLACDRTPKALMTVYETSGSTPVKSGAMMAADKNLRTAGTIGGGCGEHAVLTEAYRLIGTGGRRCVTVDMSGDVAEEEGMVCGGRMRVLIEDVTEKEGARPWPPETEQPQND